MKLAWRADQNCCSRQVTDYLNEPKMSTVTGIMHFHPDIESGMLQRYVMLSEGYTVAMKL